MFYEPKNGHGLPHCPLKSCIVPRPIGWISTISSDGVVNLAPFSFFNGCGEEPFQVMFSPNGRHADGGRKDTLVNVEATGEFVINMATWDLREAMNETGRHVGREVNEMELAGLEMEPSVLVAPPRVKASPIHLECAYIQTVSLRANSSLYPNSVVFGEVIGVHIADSVLTDGMVDMAKFTPIARLGYQDYSVIDNVFTMKFPDGDANELRRKAKAAMQGGG